MRNVILNICVDEDSMIGFEKKGVSNWKWLMFFMMDLECEVSCINMSKDDVLLKLKEWYDVKFEEWDDVRYRKSLKLNYDKFVNELNSMMSENVLIGRRWSVEYDDNFGVMMKVGDD